MLPPTARPDSTRVRYYCCRESEATKNTAAQYHPELDHSQMVAIVPDGESPAVGLNDDPNDFLLLYAVTLQQTKRTEYCTAGCPLGLRAQIRFLGGNGTLMASKFDTQACNGSLMGDWALQISQRPCHCSVLAPDLLQSLKIAPRRDASSGQRHYVQLCI